MKRRSSLHAITTLLFVVSSIVGLRTARADEPAPAEPSAERSCILERRVGLTEEEAAAVEEVVCGALRGSPSYAGRNRIRVTRLGRKIVLTLVTDRPNGTVSSKRLVLSSIEEATVAAPRLIEASADDKPIEETVAVDTVVGDESRVAKKKQSHVHAWLAVLGAGAPAIGTGGGVAIGLSAGSDRWSFVTDLRVAGQAFNKPAGLALGIVSLGSVSIESDAAFSHVSLAGGVRHHFSAGDVAPFVGMGIGLDYLGRGQAGITTRDPFPDAKHEMEGKTGIAAYAELGLDVLRTNVVGGAFVLRADAPAFSLEYTEQDASDPSKTRRVRSYAPILSAGIAMRF